MESKEDWISAAAALALLKPTLGESTAMLTIAERAHDEIVRSRAARLVMKHPDKKAQVDQGCEVPSGFWWARGHSALKQNWTAGDFETWIGQTIHLRAYGVRFLRSEIMQIIPADLPAEPATASDLPKRGGRSPNKVFLVHGHDEAVLQAAARFVEQLGLQAIILREQADQGRTIIEKFEACAAEVGFAIVLLTPDDLSGPADGAASGARARQNVVFELGYFAGKLGRGRTCLLRKGNVDIPSDLYGVIYTEIDPAEGWKRKLARELKAAGFNFDAAKVWE
jgi:predicted nucleotide-binding protein